MKNTGLGGGYGMFGASSLDQGQESLSPLGLQTRPWPEIAFCSLQSQRPQAQMMISGMCDLGAAMEGTCCKQGPNAAGKLGGY